MAQYTPNFNLYEPDSSDDFADFRTEFNNNMNIIDQNLGGGGSGGHTIIDENGSDMPAESKLQFTGNVSVTDDNVNGATVVDVLGGGGNVYGAFLDPSRVVYSAFTFDSSTHSWTATEDCILTDNMTPPDSSTAYFIRIDGKQVFAGYSTVEDPFVYVKKGQVVEYRAKSGSTMKAYGILQGTNGIFAPVIYSDNERVIGVWRDNKPLYQRTFVYTPSATISTTTVITTLSSDIEVKDIKGVAVNTQNNRVLSLGYAGNNFGTNFGTSASNDLQIEIYSDSWGTNYTFFATVQYTKTTDVAGSGDYNTYGVPTVHYSTSEQVIGTWINSKPLYQKTLILRENGVDLFTYSGNSYLNCLPNDIEFIDIVQMFMPRSGGDAGYVDVRNNYNEVQVVPNISNQSIYLYDSHNPTDTILTIQFTKTTD